jgi:hypothetical protein
MPDPRPRGPAVGLAFAIFLLSATLAGICWLAAGPTLGLFLGPPALLCILIPQTVSVTDRAIHRWAIWLLATLGTAIIWYSALPDIVGTNARQVGLCVIVLSALILLLVAATDALLWSGIRPTAAAAWITVLCLIWLSWPIWLSGHLTGHLGETIANRLVYAHPLFAINAALHFDLWDHYPFMYSTLSSLNQDVPYRIPPSIWPAVIVQGAPAAALLLIHPAFARQLAKRKLNRQGAKTPS